jgi:uncharacterized protein YpmB
MLTAIVITGIVVTVLCTAAHEYEVKKYKKQIKELREQKTKCIDEYFALLETRAVEQIQQATTSEDYIMD